MPKCPHCSEAIESLDGYVAKTRLDSVIEARNRASGEAATLKEELAIAEESAKASEALQVQVTDLTTKLGAADSRYETYSTLTGVGLTEAGIISATVTAWEKLPEDSRGTLAETAAAWKADPSLAGKLLEPHFKDLTPQAPAEPGATPPAPAPVKPPAPGLPDASKGALPAPAPAGGVADRLLASAAAGDLSAFKGDSPDWKAYDSGGSR